MLTYFTNYAVSQGLPYEFVEWALETFGYDVDSNISLETAHRDWNDFVTQG